MMPPWLKESTLLQAEVGSGLHGIADGTPNDRDEMGVCLEPFEAHAGLWERFEQHIYRTAAVREGKSDAPSQPGDLDLMVYSLRKFVRLALDGNPTVLLLLYAPPSHTVIKDARGSQLQEMASAFASRRAGRRFLGYLQQQRQRLLGERGQKNVNRADLVAQYGFDTKYAGHMLRLGFQGVEFMDTGRLELPMPEPSRQRVLAVRQGKVDINEVLAQVGELEQRLKDLCDTSPLPEEPMSALVEEWVLERYWHHWAATYGHAQSMRFTELWQSTRTGQTRRNRR